MKTNGNPIAVITGASRGIGRAIAMELSGQGFTIALVASHKRQLTEVKNEILQRGGNALVCPADLTAPNSCTTLYAQVRERLGVCACLVHNAAILGDGDLSHAQLSDLITTNLSAPMELTRLFWSDLVATGGTLAFIASTASQIPIPYLSPYCATKHGLLGFAESTRFAAEQQGIHLLTAFPPMTRTDMTMPMAERIGFPASRLHSPDAVGQQIARAITARRRTWVGSWFDRAALVTNRLFPRLVQKVLRWKREKFQIMAGITE